MSGNPGSKATDSRIQISGKSVPLYLQVYDALRDAIRRQDLQPKDRITEKSLADMLGVSRTPAREALRLGVSEGFVTEAEDGALHIYAPDPQALSETYLFRSTLEPIAARLMVHRRSELHLKQMSAALADARDAADAGDPQAMADANTAFHQSIISGSASLQLQRILEVLDARMVMYRPTTLGTEEARTRSLAAHGRIHDAICKGDVETAANLTRDHILNAAVRALGRMDGGAEALQVVANQSDYDLPAPESKESAAGE